MNIKSEISGWLRKMNLLSAAERTRFYLQKIKFKKNNTDFKKEHPDFVLPPEFFVYETYRLNYREYYEDGKTTAEELVQLFSKLFKIHDQQIRILDWGCGPGRIVRHFPLLLKNAEVYGTDYNEKYISWCDENLKGINFSVNNIDPPANYNEFFFDAVIRLSIFTHLSEKNHFEWIRELHRIIKFGGVILTTQGNAYYSKLTGYERRLFDAGKLVTRKYLDEGNRLYSSFHPQIFIKELISGKFEIIEFIPGQIENGEPLQDVWLLKKI